MKRFIAIILIATSILLLAVSAKESVEYTFEELTQLMNENLQKMNDAHALAELARSLGWNEDCEAIKRAKLEYSKAYSFYQEYKQLYEDLQWANKANEYPVATQIWRYMKDLGWNDYVCAGIMGNIMTEVGGRTLDIQYWLKGSYYGICQWSKGYKKVWGADLEEQLEFLKDTIEYELNIYGYAYKRGFNFEAFLELTDEREVAEAFAACYERSSQKNRYIRKDCAEKAYDYFVN